MKSIREFGIRFSISTVNRYIDDLHFSFKRICPVPERRNTASTIQARFEYAIKFNKIRHHLDKIFFIDETGIQIHARTNYGRSAVGQRKYKPSEANHYASVKLCARINYISMSARILATIQLISFIILANYLLFLGVTVSVLSIW